ncbi:MAG: ferritin-like domain-containing protein [Sphingosinicella sp.]
MFAAARRRYLDILASIYIYNEHRGYSSIDRVIAAVRSRYPEETVWISRIEKHRRDERQHYLMFRRYFEHLGYMPYFVDRTCAHIDRLIRLTFGCGVDDLDEIEIINDDEKFQLLCRVIMLTEMRGMRQVEILLRSRAIRDERPLLKIFKVIERDEPSHWAPYQYWVERQRGRMPSWRERLADELVHRTLILIKLPLLYLNPRLARRTHWYDEGEPDEQDRSETVAARHDIAELASA